MKTSSGSSGRASKPSRGSRRVLSDELGLDPSPTLRGLEGAILRHEPLPQEMFPATPLTAIA
jgi:hypothetical protein